MDRQLTRSAFSLPRSFKTQRSAALLPSCYSGATQLVSGAPPLSCLLSALRFSANCLFAFPSPLSLARDACYTSPRSLLSVFAAISRTPLVASASCDTCEVQASLSLRLINSEPCGSLRPSQHLGRHPGPFHGLSQLRSYGRAVVAKHYN